MRQLLQWQKIAISAILTGAGIVEQQIFKRPFEPYTLQNQAVFNDKRFSVTPASTKSGKTAACIIWLIEQMLEAKAYQQTMWVAPVYAQSQIAFKRTQRYLRESGITFKPNKKDYLLEFSNNRTMFFRSGDDPDNLYGDDMIAIVVDEASRCKDDVFVAVRSLVTHTRGRIRYIGNVKGKQDEFYALCQRAKKDIEEFGIDSEFHYSELTAWDAVDAGVLDREEIESARRSMPDYKFQQLYLAKPVGNIINPFGTHNIDKCCLPYEIETADGYIEWENPDYDGEELIYGCDLGQSVDWTVVIGMTLEGVVMRVLRIQKDSWPTQQKKIDEFVGDAECAIDSTGVGKPVYDWLEENGKGLYTAVVFGPKSKQELIYKLSSSIQAHSIMFPMGVIYNELDSFERIEVPNGVRYSAPEGMHDDAVMALALANHMFTELPADIPIAD